MSKEMEVKICPDCEGKGEIYKTIKTYPKGVYTTEDKFVDCKRCWKSGRIVITTEIRETPFFKPEGKTDE